MPRFLAHRLLLAALAAALAPAGLGLIAVAAPVDGARAGGWWSLQPVRPAAPPAVREPSSARHPIDRFVFDALRSTGLKSSPPADRRTLIRRLTFDVIGLPPTPEEIDAFLNDARPDAYERMVDRLLGSPHYGERWARHWLDVIRFGETQGFERNKLRPNAWKYRDWVVEALNADMPYDEFARLQIAGDVLRPEDPLAVIASGFLVMGPYDLTAYTDGTAMMRAAAREEELEGLVATVSQTFLGLTVNCARCHDHKFDPIPQKEYYRIAAALAGTFHGDERESLTAAGREKAEQARRSLEKEKERLAAMAAAGAESERARLDSRMRLLSGGPAHVSVPKEPGVVHVLARGDFRSKGEPVAPGGLSALAGSSPEWGLAPNAPEAERRKALAAWITSPQNPLTARVIVNRLWTHHFGAGLVQTPSDFGALGGKPSHQELLDWLAGELVRSGWSLKRIHRLILTSETYRQASRPRPEAIKNDAENRLLWRQNPRRLEAEPFRDAVLAVSGDLVRSIGGPGFRDWTVKSQGNNEIYTVIDEDRPEFKRRSLYRMVIRAGTHPLLDVLDCPDPSVATARRTATTTPLQALTLLNGGFMERSAARMARRLRSDAGESPDAQVHLAYRLAFGRRPTAEEAQFAREFARKHGLDQLCLVLLNANEFVFVD